jgi:DNA gyrase subunit A
VRVFSPDRYLIFATRKGTVKKTSLAAFGNPRAVGINAMNVLEGDELIDVQLSDGQHDVVLATHQGMAVRFRESDVREMGRATTGVRGIMLGEGDRVIGMVVLKQGSTLLVVTERGMGKRTGIEDYRLQRRGGKGVINVRTTDKTGKVVAIKEVLPGDELMVITREGVVNRQSVDGIRVIGRNTQGVRLINLGPRDIVMDVARVINEAEIVVEALQPVGDGGSSTLDPVADASLLGDTLPDEDYTSEDEDYPEADEEL